MQLRKRGYKQLELVNQTYWRLLIKKSSRQSILDFCEKQTRNHRHILLLEEAMDQTITIITGGVGLKPDTDFSMYLFCSKQNIYPEQHAFIEATRGVDYVFIQDVQVMELNQGYGSTILQFLISLCKLNNFNKIIGQLKSVDVKDHGQRLFHFYQKHGFTIMDTEEPEEKLIELCLAPSSVPPPCQPGGGFGSKQDSNGKQILNTADQLIQENLPALKELAE